MIFVVLKNIVVQNTLSHGN